MYQAIYTVRFNCLKDLFGITRDVVLQIVSITSTVFTLLFPLRDYYFNLIKTGGIIREAGILERRDYFVNALKSSCRYGFN